MRRMRRHVLWLLALSACASSPPIPGELENEGEVPATPTTAAPATATPTAEPAASSEPAAPPNDDGERWSVERGSANGVNATNEVGQKIAIGALAYTAFLRQTAVLSSKDIENANVKFGTVVADGLTLGDVVCRLPSWSLPEDTGAEVVTSGKIVGFVAQDAVTVATPFAPPKGVRACGKGIQPRVSWSFAKSAIQSVTVTGVSAKEASCIEKAVRAGAPLGTGACAVTLAL